MTKEERRAVRKDLGRVNRFTLLYSLVFTLVTFGAMIAGIVPLVADNPDVALEKVQEVMNQQSGVTSLTALIFGLVFILLNRRRQLFASDLRTPDRRPMTASIFFAAVALLFTAQVLFFAIDPVVRWVAEQFGYSMYTTSDSLEDASGTLAMILYAGFLGPIVEEVIFRGVVLRGLAKYGKIFAIVTSAALFGIFHCDIVQGLFAFAAGLVFGVVAMEFGIGWSIALHIVNNFVLADLMARAFALLPAAWQEPAQIALIFGVGIIGGGLALWKNRANIASYYRANRTEHGVIPVLWTVPSFWLFLLMQLAVVSMSFTKVG